MTTIKIMYAEADSGEWREATNEEIAQAVTIRKRHGTSGAADVLELADGTYLNNMADGRLYDENGARWTRIDEYELNDDGEVVEITKSLGVIKAE